MAVTEGVDLGVSRCENMRVSLSFIEVRSAGLDSASTDIGVLPLALAWPFWGVRLGDFLPEPSWDRRDLELETEPVLEPLTLDIFWEPGLGCSDGFLSEVEGMR